MNQSYNERVQAIAEGMYNKIRKQLDVVEPEQPENKQEIMNILLIPLAHDTVKQMTEAVTDALSELLPIDGEDYEDGDNKYVIPGYLSANGLIPDSGQEDSEDV